MSDSGIAGTRWVTGIVDPFAISTRSVNLVVFGAGYARRVGGQRQETVVEGTA
jgi:hypothetical protein